MRKLLSMMLLVATMVSMLTVGAQAADYSFETVGEPDYYSSTSYEDIFGTRYQYAGTNLVDYQIPALKYGSSSTTQTGVMEKSLLPGLQRSAAVSTVGGYGVTGGYGISSGASVVIPGVPVGSGTTLLPELSGIPQFTKLTDDFLLSNGAIGRISIPAIGVRNYYVWEDTASSSMKKGLGHFTTTSVWDGNVGIAGHNRGAKYVIGDINELEPGDKITYTTSEGTRTYEVETVAMIRNDDWSYLEATADNRITLVTCVKDDSGHRWCVQALEYD